MPEDRKLRFGIIGCGGAAIPVTQALAASPVAEPVAAFDLNLALAQDLGQGFGLTVHDSLEALLASAAVEADSAVVLPGTVAGVAAASVRVWSMAALSGVAVGAGGVLRATTGDA